MPWCKTENKEVLDPNPCVQSGHEVFVSKPHLKFDIAHFLNHNLVEPVIWAISAYGIVLGLFATFAYGFFTLKEYSLGSLVFFLTPNQVQNLDLWYDAYPYSLIIFGSYLLSLYLIFNRQHKGYLAMPVFLITYATWDFLGIGTHFIYGVNIIWLGIALLSLIYYFPLRKQFSVNISFPGLLLFFGLGILDLQNIFLHLWPFTDITIVNMGVSATILQYFNGISNEATFCIFCILSIHLKTSTQKLQESILDTVSKLPNGSLTGTRNESK